MSPDATTLSTNARVNATADGYTLLLVPPAVAANATLYEHLNFDFIRDAAPVAGATDQRSTIPRTPLVSGVTIGMMELLLNYWGLVHVTKCYFSAPCDALECISS